MQKHLVITIDKLSWGGIQRVMFALAEALVDRGVGVDFAVCEAGGALRDKVPAGVRVFQLQRNSNLATRLAALRSGIADWKTLLRPVLLARKPPGHLVYLPSFVGYLQAQRPQVILAAGRTLNIMSVMARRLAGSTARLVLSEHVAPSCDLAGSRKWGRRYLPPLMARAYAGSDAVIAVSGGVAEDLSLLTGLRRSDIRIIYNPIVSRRLVALADQPSPHPWLEPGQPPVILGAGRLVEQKDFPTLVRAFGLLRRERDARLIIVGGAKNEMVTARRREELLALAREMGVDADVHLPGYVPSEQVPAYMARAALFALSSVYEGFGNVLVEAMAQGCPVVSTDCRSGPSEILEGGKWGPLVPVGDHEALAGAMKAVLDQPPEREALRRRGAEFSVAAAADRYMSALFPP
ncbi:MAG TPA: glycosyltransferase [Gammaproteobacteria bacterium]|nr:glycosyltransferase [Gammaproteobacteria bacterium]